MTTRDFITKAVTGGFGHASKECSSVMFDGENVYSYGYHYPLLVQVAGQWILNDSGYSNTTAKHINWATGHANYRMHIDGKEWQNLYRYTTGKELAKVLYKQALAEMDEVVSKINKLTPRAKISREALNHRRHELVLTAGFLKKQIN